MPDPAMVDQWHEFRKHLARVVIGLWMMTGLLPAVGLVLVTKNGHPPHGPAWKVILLFVVPIILITVSLGYAIAVLRTRTPHRSRSLTWPLVATFVAGLGDFVVCEAIFYR